MSIDEQLRRAADAHRADFDVTVVPQLPTRRRHGARAAVALVAVAAIVTAVAFAALNNRSSGEVHVTTPPSAPPADRPAAPAVRDAAIAAAPLLAPTWAPGGEQLWSVDAGKAPSPLGSLPSQLFGTVAGDGTLSPGLLLEFQPNPPGGGVGSTSARVRGADASVSPPKDAAGADLEIRWVESNADITAIVRGLSQDQAISALDSMHARSSNLMAGFEPASAPAALALLGERTAAGSEGNVTATFEYARAAAPGHSSDLEVRTQTRVDYPGYFRTWIGGSRGADGVVIEPDSYGPYQMVTLAWPDGRSVDLRSTNMDLATLERIGRSSELLSRADADALVRDLDGRLAALPTLGTATLTGMTVEVRHDGERVALCLLVGDASPVCRTNVTLDGPTNAAAGGALIGDQWVVFAAAEQEPTITTGTSPIGSPLNAVQTATIGQWRVAVAQVPAAVDEVQVNVPTGSNESSGETFTRPAAGG